MTGAERLAHNEIPVDAAGRVLGWDDALAAAERRAVAAGLPRIWVIDRTGEGLEADVLAHHGDHGFADRALDDTDAEDGVTGSDMRDGLGNSAPRRF